MSHGISEWLTVLWIPKQKEFIFDILDAAVISRSINRFHNKQKKANSVGLCDGYYTSDCSRKFTTPFEKNSVMHWNKSSFIKACYYENISSLEWLDVLKI